MSTAKERMVWCISEIERREGEVAKHSADANRLRRELDAAQLAWERAVRKRDEAERVAAAARKAVAALIVGEATIAHTHGNTPKGRISICDSKTTEMVLVFDVDKVDPEPVKEAS